MLDFLFRRLTAEPRPGEALFGAATQEARQPYWYREAGVPDTLDSRFAMLSTVMALILVRLERDDEQGNLVSVALTERFIEVMESEHRELGLGDPTLGRTVRKLVGSLSWRTDLWRRSAVGGCDWRDAVRQSIYKDAPAEDAQSYADAALKEFWSKLERADLATLAEGRLNE
jgi:cytochrome b pre-mRNA-processing protein 3